MADSVSAVADSDGVAVDLVSVDNLDFAFEDVSLAAVVDSSSHGADVPSDAVASEWVNKQ